MSAKRLTDRQKKKIIADYVQLQSYARTAKLNDVAESTVRKIVKDNPKCADIMGAVLSGNFTAHLPPTLLVQCERLSLCGHVGAYRWRG